MTRTMGDAISSQASALPPGLDLVAGYDTGTADIRWTEATFAQFPGIPHVHIDQGGNGAPAYSANVIDVETGAWSPQDVPGWIARCTAPVPTVYCNRSTLPAVLATGWRGPVWLAFPGGQVSSLPVLPPGCWYVAVQDDFQTLYDLSTVLDPAWPGLQTEDPVLATAQFTIEGTPPVTAMIAAPVGADNHVYITSQAADGSWSKTGPIGGPVPIPGKIEAVIEVTANVPYVFIHAVDPVASGVGDVYLSQLAAGTWTAWAKIT